jgi:hypothetical protein
MAHREHPCKAPGWTRAVETIVVGSRPLSPREPLARKRQKEASRAAHIAAVARSAGWADADARARDAEVAKLECSAPVLLYGRRAVYVSPAGEHFACDKVDALLRAAPRGARFGLVEYDGDRRFVAIWSRAPGFNGMVSLKQVGGEQT